MVTITESLVRRAKPRKSKFEISCSTVRGFVLRVLPSGKKVYYARRAHDGKDRRHRIGLVGDVTFAEAQHQALEFLGRIPIAAANSRTRARPDRAQSEVRPVPRAPVLRKFLPRYLDEHVGTYLKPSTRNRYSHTIARHIEPMLGDKRLDEITRCDVEALHRAMRDAPFQANNTVMIVSGIFEAAFRWGVLDRQHVNPAKGIRRYKERRREFFLTPTQRATLEEVLTRGESIPPGRRGAIRWATAGALRLLAHTGMRLSEILLLEWGNVDRRYKCLRLPDSKTGQKIVPISDQALQILEDLEAHRVDGCDFVIYSRLRGPIHRTSLEDSWRRIRQRAGLSKVRIHDLRHSAASDAINAGVPLEVIQRILGHADIRTTQRYAHLARGVVAEGVARMGASIEAGSRGQTRANGTTRSRSTRARAKKKNAS